MDDPNTRRASRMDFVAAMADAIARVSLVAESKSGAAA
jgi:hypothetical protein